MEIHELYQKYLETGKVSTDTRQITSGSVFFALKGPAFNANEFVLEALAKGASYAVVDEQKYAVNDRCILVANGLKALQDLARYHRRHLKIPFIGLTGSNGKTTSKELLNAVLSKKYKVYATRGNLNNHIGVPLTVLSVDKTHEIAVIEMGANHLEEIALLSDIADPTHGFITNLGRAHIGTFGGFENIVRGKSELFQHLLTNNGTAFINSQDPLLSNMAKRFKNPVFYPAKGDYFHCEFLGVDPFVMLQTETGEKLTTQLIGAYNFENIAAALCIGKYFGVSSSDANAAVMEYVPGNMRSQVLKKGSNTILLDAYNANPSSMEAAINNLAGMTAKRKIAILGDMYELEDDAEVEHGTIGKILRKKGIKEAYLCGPLMKAAQTTFPDGKFFPSKEELIKELQTNPIQDALILIKASRGMAMEKILDFI
ncbi:UDP-N-acetylmuramoyl-tripeptide--D-alanyl-D-alanine ligase [soil metagenome]